MEFLVRKVLGAIAGVAICIAIWTIQDRLTGGGDNTIDSIPTVVWGGGAGVVTIGCSYGYGDISEIEDADYRVDRFPELLDLPLFSLDH